MYPFSRSWRVPMETSTGLTNLQSDFKTNFKTPCALIFFIFLNTLHGGFQSVIPEDLPHDALLEGVIGIAAVIFLMASK